jgi:hypothetical protein
MSTVNGYGAIQAKKIEVANQVVFHGASDDTNEVTFNCADPASDYTVTMPAAAGTLLTDQDAIELSQIDINGASEESSASNTHEIAIYDGAANKKMTLATLAALSDFNSLPSGTDGQIVVYDSADAGQAVSMSGDATIANDGVITLSDKPSAEKSAEANKFAHFDANRDLDNINVIEASTVAGDNVEVGNGTNRWQFNVNASGHLELKYSSDSGSTFAVKQVFNNA